MFGSSRYQYITEEAQEDEDQTDDYAETLKSQLKSDQISDAQDAAHPTKPLDVQDPSPVPGRNVKIIWPMSPSIAEGKGLIKFNEMLAQVPFKDSLPSFVNPNISALLVSLRSLKQHLIALNTTLNHFLANI